MTRSKNIVVKTESLYKNFKVGNQVVPALKGVDLKIHSGEFLIIYGPSGCGKSTLLHCILGLEPPSSGLVWVRGRNLYQLTPSQRASFRKRKFGILFQQSEWVKSISVLDNVALPLCLKGVKMSLARQKALRVLEEVGMADWASHHPAQLSGGQQQKVALARAMITKPWILVCDEPTGNMDSKSARELFELLQFVNQEKKRTIILVTHELSFLKFATRQARMRDGKIIRWK